MKNFLKYGLSLILSLNICSAFAQELPEVIPPTPTVANLMQFEEVPVSYYTGQPNISIPIYSKAINGDLALNIGLSYNTQGIKINNRSGWTGTGWSLSAGGVISRTVRGLPDELVRNTASMTGEGVFHIADYWNYDNLSTANKQRFLWKAGGTPIDKYDHESDLFQFSFLGVSGRFVIIREGSALVPKLLTKNQNIKIDIDYTNNPGFNDHYKLNKFTITDTKGYVYTFDVIEDVTSTPFSQSQLFDNSFTDIPTGQHITSTNAWHLSKIEMPNLVGQTDKELVKFTYQNSFEAYNAAVSRTTARPINYSVPTFNDHMSVSYNASITMPKETVSYYVTSSTTKKLDSVLFRDGTYLKFDLRSSTHPEIGGKPLEYIRIKDASHSENKHFKFVYDNNVINTSRLWLDSIDEVAGVTTNTYSLEYNDKYGLPDFDSPNNTDNWGYHTDTTGSQCGTIMPDSTAIYKGLLERIIYPTEGSKEFEFERHTITYQGNTQLSNDVYRDKNPDNWIVQSKDQDYVNSATTANPNAASFTLSQEQEVFYKQNSLSGTQADIDNTAVEIRDSNGLVLYTIQLGQVTEARFTLDAGTYEIHYVTLNSTPNVTANVCIGYKDFQSQVKQYVYGGGVRIKSIRFKDDPLTSGHEKEILFKYDEFDGQLTSTGSIDGLLDGLLRVHVEQNTRIYLPGNCPINANPITDSATYNFEVRTTDLNAQLTQGQYVGYKKVRAFETGNGYSEFTFTSAQDHYSPSDVFTYPYKPANDIDYKRGLLLREGLFNQAGDTLKITDNYYTFSETTIAPSYKLYQEDCEWKRFYDYYDDYMSSNPNKPLQQCGSQVGCQADCLTNYSNCGMNTTNPLKFENNHVKSTWAKLAQTDVKEYFYDGLATNIKESRQKFYYSDDNYQISATINYFDENGEEMEYRTEYYYPYDDVSSNTLAIRNKLIALNKVNEALEIHNYRVLRPSPGVKINDLRSQTNTIYNEYETDLVLPQYLETLKGQDAKQIRIEFIDYDSYGNPIEVSKKDGTSISYVWGFNSSVPVAQVINASYLDIEALSAFGSGFSLSGNLSVSQNTALRGIANTHVSTYEYDPVVGVIETIDPRDYSMSYEYDDLNRLYRVKDDLGHILSENEYQYGTQNYIKTTTFQVETTNGTTNANTSNTLTDDEKIESITYADGLGRAIQSITKQAGGNKQDIITPIEYDDYGRQPIQYLPYADSNQTPGTGNLNFRNMATLLSDLETYYVGKYGEDKITVSTINAYSEMRYEASPLNRVLEQGEPGADWLIDVASDNDHTIKFDYQLNSYDANNTSADNIKLYRVDFLTTNTEDPILVHEGYYDSNELYKTITKDENWQTNDGQDHTVEEYTDSRGQVILKRTFNNGVRHDTQYVYDDFGNLTYVLSPKGSNVLLTLNSLNNFSQTLANKHIDKAFSNKFVTATGSGSISLTGYQFSVDLNVDFSTPEKINPGGLIQLSGAVPDMFVGIIQDTDVYYVVSVQDGYLHFEGDGVVSSINESFDVTVPEYGISQDELDALCYQYHYDRRNRLVEKKIPGKGWESIVYDKLDRPVMTQDANLEAQNKWLFTKYDAFDRVVYTGIQNSASTRLSKQSTLNGQVNFNESRTTTSTNVESNVSLYYTNAAYPTTSIDELHTVNYYDSHSSSAVASNPGTVFGVSTNSNTNTLPTNGKVRTLGTNDWTYSATYYDAKGRPLFLASESDFLISYDEIESKLDFLGKPLETKTTHTKDSNTVIIDDDFTYDHAGRLLTHEQQIGTHTELIVSNTYNEIGQLENKAVGNTSSNTLQNIDYTYNIRGWLREINDHRNLSSSQLFGFEINYNNPDAGATALYNGNISESIWKTINDDNGSGLIRAYRYDYDDLNRITGAEFGTKTQAGSFDFIDQGYKLKTVSYDVNGNIISLERYGEYNTNDTNDELSYTYDGNQLLKVDDNATTSTTGGFIDGNTSGDDYYYDANGNIIKDYNKNITLIEYNHLNLPTRVDIGSENIQYIYDATGQKLSKTVSNGDTTEYVGNFIYVNSNLKFFSHPEGYVEPDGSGYNYIYQYKDHLDNIRLTYGDFDDNGSINTSTEIIEEHNYYPFGLKHKGYNDVVSANVNSTATRWKFGGKEYSEELGLDWYDFSARNYEASLGRWMNLDALADAKGQIHNSPYAYAMNDPIAFNDPDGNCPPGIDCGGIVAAVSNFVDRWTTGTIIGHSNFVNNSINGMNTMTSLGAARINAVFEGDFETFSKVNKVQATGTILGTIEAVEQPFEGIVDLLNGDIESAAANFAETTDNVMVAVVTEGATRGVSNIVSKADNIPKEAYNRRKHYGNTPTKADRKHFGAGKNHDVDHKRSLVEHYYEDGGHKMTKAERVKFAKNRNNMRLRESRANRSDGGRLSQYSKAMKQKYRLYDK